MGLIDIFISTDNTRKPLSFLQWSPFGVQEYFIISLQVTHVEGQCALISDTLPFFLHLHKFVQSKDSFAISVNVLSVLKLLQLSNGDLLFSQHVYSIYTVRKPRMTKLGNCVEVRAHSPIAIFINILILTKSFQMLQA